MTKGTAASAPVSRRPLTALRSGHVLSLPVLKTTTQPFVLVFEEHVVVIHFNATLRPNSVALLDDGFQKRLLELAQLRVDPNPMLDIAFRQIRHRCSFARQQNVVFVLRRIRVHTS